MSRTVLAFAVATIQCSLCCFGQLPANANQKLRQGTRVRSEAPQSAQSSTSAGAEAEVRRFLTDLVNASLKPDAKELERFYADEFTATNASGGVLDKAAVIAALTLGKLSFKSYELDDVRVRIYGDVAVVRDSERIETNTTSGRFRHPRVLLKGDGRRQLVATQMTRITEQWVETPQIMGCDRASSSLLLSIPLKDHFHEERDSAIPWQIHTRDYDTEMESCTLGELLTKST